MIHRYHPIARYLRGRELWTVLLALIVVGTSCDSETTTPSEAPTANPFAGRVAKSEPTGGSGNTPSVVDSVWPQDDCDRGCLAWVIDCGLCLRGSDGECIPAEACSASCRFNEREAAYACLASLLAPCRPLALEEIDFDALGITEADINACLAIGVPDLSDTCGQGCLALANCDKCLSYQDNSCLNPARCAELCRANSGEDMAACLLQVSGCNETDIDACLARQPEPFPEGACGECLLDECASEVEACQADTGCNQLLRCWAPCDSSDCVSYCTSASFGSVFVEPGSSLLSCMAEPCAPTCEEASTNNGPTCGTVDVPMAENGWVERASTGCGIQGSFYWFADSQGTTLTGVTQGSVPYRPGSGMCLTGRTVVDPDYKAWGAGIGLDLSYNTSTNIQEAWDATAYGVVGFRVTVSGTTGKVPLRFQVESLASRPADTALPFVEIEAPGTYTVLFEDARVPSDWDISNAGEAADPSSIYSISLLVVGGGDTASDFDVCLTSLRPIVGETSGTGGAGSGGGGTGGTGGTGTGGTTRGGTGGSTGSATGGSTGSATGGAAGTGDGGSTALTLDEAVHESARATCEKYQECLPYALVSNYGTLATCISRRELGEHAYVDLTGVTDDAASYSACATAVDALSCSAYLRTWPSQCTPPGTLANGEVCVSNGQCQSLWCQMDSEQCGTCADPPEDGDTCDANYNCPTGLWCMPDGVCRVPAEASESCGENLLCQSGLTCYSGMCVQALDVGDTCDLESGLYCDWAVNDATCDVSNTGACVRLYWAGPGEACNWVNGLWTVCSTSGTCTQVGAAYSCTAAVADGGECDPASGPYCLPPAACVAGSCVLERDMAVCEGA